MLWGSLYKSPLFTAKKGGLRETSPVLSEFKPHTRIFNVELDEHLGIGESEVLRQAFIEYAKSISLITERVHGKI